VRSPPLYMSSWCELCGPIDQGVTLTALPLCSRGLIGRSLGGQKSWHEPSQQLHGSGQVRWLWPGEAWFGALGIHRCYTVHYTIDSDVRVHQAAASSGACDFAVLDRSPAPQLDMSRTAYRSHSDVRPISLDVHARADGARACGSSDDDSIERHECQQCAAAAPSIGYSDVATVKRPSYDVGPSDEGRCGGWLRRVSRSVDWAVDVQMAWRTWAEHLRRGDA